MIQRFVVNDESMLPTFKEGDYVLINDKSKGTKGSVIVAKVNEMKILKKVKDIKNGNYHLISNNPRGKKYTVNKKDVIGKVVWHIAAP